MAAAFEAHLSALVNNFVSRYDEQQTLTWLRAIWQSDRQSDYTAFQRTAEYVAEELQRIGAGEVEIVPCPADGRTRMQAWTMPLAWEGGEAVLRMTAPHEEVLCDRSVEPLSCSMWSEPTPAGGARGPLVVVDNPENVSPQKREKLRGAFILTGRAGRGTMKVFAHEVGAAAIVSSFVPHDERHVDAIGWSNGWSDDGGAWVLKASDCHMTGFGISSPVAARLRKLVANGPVVCEAVVGGRVGEGTLPVVTGVLPGNSDNEVLLNGHLYEIGANDNASGAAVMLEAMRLMASMPRPRRRVRVQFTGECYGTYALFTMRGELLKRIVAGLNVDCVGEPQTEGWPHQWGRTPEAGPSAVDTLFRAALRLTETLPGSRAAAEGPYSVSDNILSDPAIGVPMPVMMRAPWTWHTSLDDWSQIDPNSMRRASVAVAAYARWLAEAGPAEADSLAETAAAEANAALADRGDLTPERQAFFADRDRVRVLWTERLGATRAGLLAKTLPELDEASLARPEDGDLEAQRTVPVRRFWGTPTFDEIPMDKREGLPDPRWNAPLIAACFWADGRRSVARIAALVRTEFDQEMPNLLKFFRVLERGGLVEFKTV
jgi:Peptidase family M28